jgi:outer membrane protein TolC
MRTRHSFWLALIAGGALLAGASVARAQEPAAESLTVDGVVRDVIAHNDRVKAAAFMEEAARREIGPAGAWDDPLLMLGAQNVPTSFKFNEDMMTMKMVGLSQKIPYAGEKGLRRRSQRAAADAAHEDRRETVLDLVTAAKTAYAELYYHRRIIDDLESQRDLYNQIIASVQARVATNQAGGADLSAAHAAAWRLDAEILSHHNEAHEAHFQLDALRGIDTPDEMPPMEPLALVELPADDQGWMDSAYVNYAPLRRAGLQANQYRLSAAASDRMRWPMLELGANYGFRENLDVGGGDIVPQSNMISISATFSLPFFNGHQQGQMAASQRAMQKERESEGAQLRKDIEADLRTLYRRAEHLRESAVLYNEKIVAADRDAYHSALTAYTTGRASLTDLLNDVIMIYRDQSMAREFEMQYARTLIQAERYTGNADTYLALTAKEGQ